MSLLGNIIGSVLPPKGPNTKLTLFKAKRSLQQFTGYVTVSEEHTDELTITDHPVEQGASISDHAFKNPAQLTITCGWSNSSSRGTRASYVVEVYRQLRDLQASRELFSVYTGKRVYGNMLFQSLSVTTDEATEQVLMVTAHLREVIIVNTTVTILPPRAAQAQQVKTVQEEKSGQKQATPASENKSILSDFANSGGHYNKGL